MYLSLAKGVPSPRNTGARNPERAYRSYGRGVPVPQKNVPDPRKSGCRPLGTRRPSARSDRGLPDLGNGCPCLGRCVPVPGKRLSYTRKRAGRVSDNGETDTRKQLIRPSYQIYPSHTNGVVRPSDNGRPVPRQRCNASLGKGVYPSLRERVPRPRVLGYIYTPPANRDTRWERESHFKHVRIPYCAGSVPLGNG